MLPSSSHRSMTVVAVPFIGGPPRRTVPEAPILAAGRDLRDGALFPSRCRPVERSGEPGTYEPREGGEGAERRYQGYYRRHGRRDDEYQDSVAVDPSLVPVRRRVFCLVETLYVDVSPLHEIIVHYDDAKERAEESAEAAQEVVHGHGTVVDVPGRHQ